jgi:hypothetical protein
MRARSGRRSNGSGAPREGSPPAPGTLAGSAGSVVGRSSRCSSSHVRQPPNRMPGRFTVELRYVPGRSVGESVGASLKVDRWSAGLDAGAAAGAGSRRASDDERTMRRRVCRAPPHPYPPPSVRSPSSARLASPTPLSRGARRCRAAVISPPVRDDPPCRARAGTTRAPRRAPRRSSVS